MAQFLYLRKQADYLNRQAERFRSLARASSDKDLRASFLRLADQFAAREVPRIMTTRRLGRLV
jgi:hypothetical protein